MSNNGSVVAKLVATFLDDYKHIKSHNMQLNWWCYALQATDIITNVHKQNDIGTQCSFHGVHGDDVAMVASGKPC